MSYKIKKPFKTRAEIEAYLRGVKEGYLEAQRDVFKLMTKYERIKKETVK